MTMQKKIQMLKATLYNGEPLDDTMSDGILSVFLELAGEKILTRMYPFLEDHDGLSVPERYVGVKIKVAGYLLQKRGAEGEIQHIENGTHRNYGAADVPDGMLAEIVPYCRVIR